MILEVYTIWTSHGTLNRDGNYWAPIINFTGSPSLFKKDDALKYILMHLSITKWTGVKIKDEFDCVVEDYRVRHNKLINVKDLDSIDSRLILEGHITDMKYEIPKLHEVVKEFFLNNPNTEFTPTQIFEGVGELDTSIPVRKAIWYLIDHDIIEFASSRNLRLKQKKD